LTVTNEAQRNEDTVEPLVRPLPVDKELPRRTVDCMPAYDAIPQDFKRQSNPWVRWQNEWFFNGLKAVPEPLDGIDGKAAMRQLNHIQRSWDTGHEHKECAVAYLASLWFRGPNKALTKKDPIR
jgi:hypothetical protein